MSCRVSSPPSRSVADANRQPAAERASDVRQRWLVRGDWDGFFGLALDNLVQLLLIDALCRYVLGFPGELLYGGVLPGVAISLAVGNLYYSWQSQRLAHRSGRRDVCALPYGINTVSLFAHVFLVMLPAKQLAEQLQLTDPVMFAYRAGLFATVGSGLIELGGAPLAERLRRLAPRAALLSTLAGIALGFISLGFLLRAFAHPSVGLLTLGVVLLTYFGKVRFRGGIPGGLVALSIGMLVCWFTGLAPTSEAPVTALGVHAPVPAVAALFGPLPTESWLSLTGIVIPMGLFNLIGSLQNIESAEAAGDAYQTAPSLAVNGAGTLTAAAFGSCFPTTIYIGHPGWKSMGARSGYSVLNAAFFCGLIFTGTLGFVAWAVPVDAGLAIVLWIGIVISAQAFQATPRHHAPAVVLGILPGVAAWGAVLLKHGLRAGNADISPAIAEKLKQADVWTDGAFSLEQGFIFTAMIWAAATVHIIERQFMKAAAWFGAAAALSVSGLLHSFRYTGNDTVLQLKPSWEFALSYAGLAMLMLATPLVAQSADPAKKGH